MLGLIKLLKKKKLNNLLNYAIIIFILIDFSLFLAIPYLAFIIGKTQILQDNKNIIVKTLPFLASDASVPISADSAIVFDKDSGTVVYGKNDQLRFSPASSAKIMAALIALNLYPFDMVLFAKDINLVDGSKMDLKEGEQITVQNLLYGLLLPSGNDAAFTLAQNINGGVKSFVEKMNNKAEFLKLSNTYFVDPDGYDDSNYTTAFDLARLSSYAMNDARFAKIVSTKEKTVHDITGTIVHKLVNLNELLDDKNVKGIKTGFTNEAGGVLVTSYFYNGKNFIIAVLKSEDRFYDTRLLISQVVKKLDLLSF